MCKYSGFKIVVINIGSIQRKLLSHLWLETEQQQQQQIPDKKFGFGKWGIRFLQPDRSHVRLHLLKWPFEF